MFLARAPCAALLPFVSRLWVAHELPAQAGVERELVLPSVSLRIVFRLSQPLRTFDSIHDLHGRPAGHINIGGPRTEAYIRDVSLPSLSVGAELRTATGALLLGVPANELAARHTALAELWGREAELIRERLAGAREPARQLDVLESALLARRSNTPGVAPAVQRALLCSSAGRDVAELVAASGYSHKHFVELFRRAVGVTPKLYSRVLRFQRALKLAADGRSVSWAQLASDTGYSDQAHFTRDFQAFSGLTPGQYERLASRFANHVPLTTELLARGKIPSRPGPRYAASCPGKTEMHHDEE